MHAIECVVVELVIEEGFLVVEGCGGVVGRVVVLE
jgi:hypothetical protein